MATNALYPPAPANVPAEITRLDSAYRLRVVAMIGGLFAFLLLYLLFIAITGLVAYWLLALPLPGLKGRAIIGFLMLKFGGAFAMVLLLVFLIKGLFKGHSVERDPYLALHEEDHPALFAFIRQVYKDTGAPAPRNVYVSAEVNAALVYDTSLINLFIPPKKDLLIGLGLVNVVNLTEFKAVLAHEFGHFAQKSVGVGSYLYVANGVMSDIIYSRDGLDEFVETWSQQDLRISFPAWGLKGMLWAVRQILSGTYKGLNLLHLSLSRQLEFNADNVAVSVTGSDALIHGLARLEFASECLEDAAKSLNAAADHGLFTNDLFYHQAKSAFRLRKLKKDERAGLPPELPKEAGQKVQVFPHVEDGIPDHYRTHPTHEMREQNAKRIYIRSPQDPRCPWLLFGKFDLLRTAVTQLFYQHMLERRETYTPEPAAKVQQFIDAEHAETTYDPRYHGLFDDRFINPGELADLPGTGMPQEAVMAWLSNWPSADLQEKVGAFQKRQGEYHLLQGLKSGDLGLKGKTFTFRDQERSMHDVARLFDQVDKETDADIAAFHELDRQVFFAHWSLARHLDRAAGRDNPRETELLERYRFHMNLQGLLQEMLGEQMRVQNILEVLTSQGEFDEESFKEIRDALREVYSNITGKIEASRYQLTPAMTNVPAKTPLQSLIMDRDDSAMPVLPYNQITGEWVTKLMTRLDAALGRVKRVHFKSLGCLLTFQEKLVLEAKPEPANREAASAPVAG